MVVSSFGTPAIGPTTVQAQGLPVGTGFTLDGGDLRFIYQQILIAQRHAATPGSSPFGSGPNQVPEVRLPFGLRTVDGSFNHLEPGTERFGASDQIFPRMTAARFPDAEAHTFDPDGPGPIEAGDPSSYKQMSGVVNDSQPRVISNLIVDQTATNPAAVEASVRAGGTGAADRTDPSGTIFIPNVAPDVGLSAPFNIMMTFFGQFFDHGLDLVAKNPDEAVFMPLKADDPLIAGPDGVRGNGDDLPPNRQFMVINRSVIASVSPGPDGRMGTADDVREAKNKTTPFVDQNQTYTSHPSHQVFLREYGPNGGTGRPEPTGRFIDSARGSIGTWADVKNQARTMLGIRLIDTDVLNVPLLATDPYGHFIPGPTRGMAQLVMEDGTLREGNSDGSVTTAGARKTGHQFLDDIAHNAVPNGTPDGDLVVGAVTARLAEGQYDNELLDIHMCTGDGRGNENIALTAVHHVFHSEHNRLADQIPGLIDSLLTPAEAAAWRAVDTASGWGFGERLFQAARFATEMQYQHLVFEEFGRKVSPSINEFIADGINFDSNTNPAIAAEFAHTVYRFGHSMLTETISRTLEDGRVVDIPLLTAFLNPQAFHELPDGTMLDGRRAAGAIFQGGTRQVANEIDEFVTEALRNDLLGLPLDLPAINLARGRSEGIPPLNEVRRQLYEAFGNSIVAPYQNWSDFQLSMRNPESVVNFIAAFGRSPLLTAAETLEEKRAAAETLFSDPNFMQGDPASTGLNDVDLWIGGLAEKQSPFGGLLGSTFNEVFERQMENLQNADRFYYLERLDGLNLLAQLEGNSFGELIARNTTSGSTFAHDVFGRPDLVFDLSAQNLTGPIVDDPATPGVNEAGELIRQADNSIRYAGAAHTIFNGRNDAVNGDHVVASEGDDTFRGYAGNDRWEGGTGNDTPIGGEGDDILTDSFGEDVIKGGPGNDAISGGFGPFDLLQGNEGNDFVVGGNDVSEVFGGEGNDIIYMGAGAAESFGGTGDDWMEGTDSPASVMVGDENNQFQNDPNGGHDVFLTGPGDADLDMEGGDDIMVANVTPTHRLEGMLGFDWASYQGETKAVDADMLVTGATAVNAPLNEVRDRYDLTEALSGTNFNDLLRGDDRLEADLRNDALTGVPNGHVLTAPGIARITSLAALLPAGATEFAGGNIILGGAGSDIIEGRGGNDILDGDAWLKVQLEGPDVLNGGTKLVNSLRAFRTDVFAGRINPGDIHIRRNIVITGANQADIDTAVFTGPAEEYRCGGRNCADPEGPVFNEDGSLTVEHNGGGAVDGIDTVRNIEELRFADRTIAINSNVLTLVPGVEGQTQAAATAAIIGANLTVGTISFANSETVPAGSVISQSPLAAASVAVLSPVNLVVSLGRADVLVPPILDLSEEAARAAIAGADLAVGAVTTEHSETVAAGLVLSQTPAAGTAVRPGSAVSFVVSLGAPQVLVPSIVGFTEGDARAAITSAGLTIGDVTSEHSDTVLAGSVISQSLAPESSVDVGTAMSFVVSLGPTPVLVPNVVGQTEADARAAIAGAGLIVANVASEHSETVAAGIVISQSPLADASVARGSAVDLVVSLGPAPVRVPNVVGQLEADARAAITGARLIVGNVTSAHSETVAAGRVISQSPVADASVARGSAVDLVISLGRAPVLVPNVVGQLEADARAAITGAGLIVGNVTSAHSETVAAGRVISQSPLADASVARGSAVGLVISLGPNRVRVPNVVGSLEADARAAITGAGLIVGNVTSAHSETVAAGRVISQSPLADASVTRGSSVHLVVSLGPAPVPVPDVTNLTEAQARAAITAARLTVGNITTENSATVLPGRIIRQTPLAGASVPPGSGVALVRSIGPVGLVLALSFDEAAGATVANDSSGSGNHGTLREARFVAGRFGNALSFDGLNDWVTVADSASLDLSSAMTLEAWVNPSAATGWHTVMLKEAGTSMAYEMYSNNPDVSRPAGYFTTTGGALRGVTGSAPLATGAWTHLAVTYDGTNMRIYVNGSLARSVLRSGTILSSAGPLHIGGNEVWGGEFYAGLMDEVRIYNRALSAEEIAADMNLSTTPPPPPPANQSPVANNDSATTDAGVAVTISVLANDSDPDGHTLTVTSTADAVGGATTILTDGRVTYTPAAGFSGAGSFTYTISDGLGGTARASANVTVKAPAPAPTPQGLVLALGLNEAAGAAVANDASGLGNNGTVREARFVAGRFGNALSFDGVNDWVTVADSASLDLSSAMTLEAWVNPSAATGWHTVMLKEAGTSMAYELYSNNPDVSRPAGYFTTTGDSLRGVTGSAPLATGAWTHVAVTYDGTNMSLYVNGSLVRTVLRSGTILSSAGVLHIGGNEVWGGEFFAGLIDELRIYNRALTATEIQTDMTTPIP